ncbi:uncharacterized protein LOC142532772 [Primulina tabacum]|uniref:uncharacterized protein LOC142532772 n=1 Tax=Primulina tabacum TaxID=48773 RepID=UPI003F5AA4B1
MDFIGKIPFIFLKGFSSSPGDDREHEEIFTDDDEAVGNDPEKRIDEEEGGLSKYGKELKKLLGRTNRLDDSDAEDDDEIEDDISPVLAPKKEAPNEKPVENSAPLKATTSGSGHGRPFTSKSSKGKRKIGVEESTTFK